MRAAVCIVDRIWELFDVPEPRVEAVKSVNRALDVLFSIAGSDRPLSALALSRELDLPRPTVYRILDTLQGRGVVARVEDGNVVTPKLGLLVGGSHNIAKLADLIGPYLQRLVAATEETSSLHVRVGDLRRCVAEVEGYRGVRWARGPGFTAPVWSGAVGHVILAHLPDPELDALMSRVEFSRLAANTLTTEDELRERIRQARENGWSASKSETVDGAAAVAAPLVDHAGAAVAVLGLYSPADRFEDLQQYAPTLVSVAAEAAALWVGISSITLNANIRENGPSGANPDKERSGSPGSHEKENT